MATDKLVDFDHVTDYISREAAIAEFCDDCIDKKWCKRNGGSCSKINNINAVPAADVAPVKRGKWVFKHHKMMGKTPCCTECGKFEPMIRNFCPNCGADMRGSNLDTTKGDNHD